MNTDAAIKLAQLKTQLEEVAGRPLDVNEQQRRALSLPIASSTYISDPNQNNDVWVTNERILFPLVDEYYRQPHARYQRVVTRGRMAKLLSISRRSYASRSLPVIEARGGS